jgi:hypothetical protein
MVTAVPVILARPPAPPAPPESPWAGLRVVWRGWDGSVWDLNDARGGLALTIEGVEGLHFPPITKHTSSSRSVPGHRIRGWQADARPVFWPVWTYGDGSEAWRLRQDAFFRTIHPDRPGEWVVTAGSQSRSVMLTGVFDDSHAYEFDPYQKGWAIHGVALEAVSPYWRGEVIRRGPWSAADGEPFIPEGGGPPFTISSAGTLDRAQINNPGDVEEWLVWELVGPWLAGTELGVGGVLFTIPFAIPDGAVLVINTDPRAASTATLDGADYTKQLGLVDFAPVPDGADLPLHIEAVGDGSVEAWLRPSFFRAI